MRNFEGDKHFIPFRQLGQYEDTETGLYYNRFRYYSPDTGTYISQDPIGLFGGDKFYAYVSDTNTWVDVLGLDHSLTGEVIRNGKTIFSKPYVSGGTGLAKPTFPEQAMSHTEKKFLSDVETIVAPQDKLIMKGELDPCSRGKACQSAIRDFVEATDVKAEYHSNSGTTYSWERITNDKVLQTEMKGGQVTAQYEYNTKTRRRKKKKTH